MKKYSVSFYYEESGRTVVKAKNKAEAEKKVMKHLTDEGLDNLDYDCKNRDYSTVGVEGVEEVK